MKRMEMILDLTFGVAVTTKAADTRGGGGGEADIL